MSYAGSTSRSIRTCALRRISVGHKRRELETEFKIAGNDLNRTVETIRRVVEQIEALSIPDGLLTNATAIESIQQDLGSYRKADADRPGLEIHMETLRKEAENRLAEIGDGLSIESADKFPLTHATTGNIQDLSKSYERLTTRIESDTSALTAQWHRQWAPAGIIPLSPKEMRAWAGNTRSIREKLIDLRIRKTGADAQTAEIDRLCLDVRTALGTAGEAPEDSASLSGLITSAKSVIEAQEQLLGQIRAIENELITRGVEQTESNDQLADLEGKLADWRNKWGKAVAKIGLDTEADPSVAGTVIGSIRVARSKMEETETLRKRIGGIDRDAEAFHRKVTELVDPVAPDLKTWPTTEAATELNARLSDARESRSRNQTLKEQLDKAEKERQAAEKRIADSSTQLEALCREAGCTAIADLPDLEKRSGTRQKLEAELTGTEDRLRSLSAGATVAEFVADAVQVSPVLSIHTLGIISA